ncbi:putative methyltransferase-domain-containing protein [Syncephalis fuscata]|nr:putative methyltransferase-domain-containing protein [Syncephalis fuscata]
MNHIHAAINSSLHKLPLLQGIDYIPVIDSYEETFALYTSTETADWVHNRNVDQKAPALILDINVGSQQHTLVFQQDRGVLGHKGTTGSVVWDSSVILARFLAKHAEHGLPLRNKSCIELGSGCGVVGITCARLGANVCLTDQASMLPLLWRNAKQNLLTNDNDSKEASQQKTTTKLGRRTQQKQRNTTNNTITSYGSIQVAELTWEDHGSSLSMDEHTTWQYLFASDCVYNEHIVSILVGTMKQLAHKDTLVLIAQELRSDTVHLRFIDELFAYFNIWRVVPTNESSSESFATAESCVIIYVATLKI